MGDIKNVFPSQNRGRCISLHLGSAPALGRLAQTDRL